MSLKWISKCTWTNRVASLCCMVVEADKGWAAWQLQRGPLENECICYCHRAVQALWHQKWPEARVPGLENNSRWSLMKLPCHSLSANTDWSKIEVFCMGMSPLLAFVEESFIAVDDGISVVATSVSQPGFSRWLKSAAEVSSQPALTPAAHPCPASCACAGARMDNKGHKLA